MKQLEHFEPKKTYIDNFLKQEIWKYKTDELKIKIMSDALNNCIWDVYWYIWARIHSENNIKELEIIKKFYNFEVYDEKVRKTLEIYEEIKNNKNMVEEIFKRADWEVLEDCRIIWEIYKEIKNTEN